MSPTRAERRLEELLEDAPGPFPWYLQPSAREMSGARHAYEWKPLGSDPPFTGNIALHRKRGGVHLIAGMYCYVRAVEGTRFLVWHPDEPGPGEAGAPQVIRFTMIDADRLEAIDDVRATCARMEKKNLSLAFTGGDAVTATIPTSTPDGVSRVGLPKEFEALDEILVLAKSTAPLTKNEPRMRLRIWSIRPAEGTIEVIPQDWFNGGQFDFDYEWVTRVARDPKSKRLVCDGIRLGRYELDESGRNLARSPDPTASR